MKPDLGNRKKLDRSLCYISYFICPPIRFSWTLRYKNSLYQFTGENASSLPLRCCLVNESGKVPVWILLIISETMYNPCRTSVMGKKMYFSAHFLFGNISRIHKKILTKFVVSFYGEVLLASPSNPHTGRPSLFWPWIGTDDGRLWVRWWTLGLRKIGGICWLAEDLLASQEVLYCMELVSYRRRAQSAGSPSCKVKIAGVWAVTPHSLRPWRQ